MPNANLTTTTLGYEIYADAGGAIDREAVNRRLAARAMAPISNRTFRHYGKLLEHYRSCSAEVCGFGDSVREYLPINQFDVPRGDCGHRRIG